MAWQWAGLAEDGVGSETLVSSSISPARWAWFLAASMDRAIH
jgi:hypothetical protein